jgi:membrane associated rhomboid family serine protease
MKFGNFSVTFCFIAICVLVFIIQQFSDITDYLSFTPAFAYSRPWTFVTAIFLHADITHILFNMIALFFFGIYLEKKISKKSYIFIFLLAGIIGNVGYYFSAPDSSIPGLGASGAIYGIMGTLTVLAPTAVVFVYGIPMPMFVAAIFWFLLEFFGLFAPSDIAHGAHLGGLFVGIILGVYFRLQMRKSNAFIFRQKY